MKKLLTALLFGTLIACNGTEPPPLDPPPVDPPPEECDLIPDDCLEGEEFDGVACECTPVEPPPVDPPPVERPPPATSDPGDYVHIDRVDGIVNGTPGAPNLLHWCPDAMWRDPEKFAVEPSRNGCSTSPSTRIQLKLTRCYSERSERMGRHRSSTTGSSEASPSEPSNSWTRSVYSSDGVQKWPASTGYSSP